MKTYIKEIKEDIGDKFWLGLVVKIHELGDYGIVEYLPYKQISDKKNGYENYSMFSTYIKGKYLGRSSDSIESAICNAIAIRYDGSNSTAGTFFMRMIMEQSGILKERKY